MIQLEPFQLSLIILSIISLFWAIRAHFKNYQKEDSVKAAESALTTERISSLNSKYDTLTQRISEIEKSHTELHVIKSQMNSMYDDMQSVKTKVDSIIQILLGKVHSGT
jgi:uncharacterized protein YlxW (UPF0749 family)